MIDQKNIREILYEELRGESGIHAGLWLDKYIRNQKRGDDTSRRELVNEVAALPQPPEYAAFFKRWQDTIAQYKAQTRRIRVQGRMVVGLGNESLLEASICLHRTYGVPYIPGSALKGLAASYAHHRLGGGNADDPKDSEEVKKTKSGWKRGGQYYEVIFGKDDKAGYITFLDALPLPASEQDKDSPLLVPDVLTVHHQKYYQDAGGEEKSVPRDSDDPNPVPFLSASGTYLLALAAPDFKEPTRWVDLTFQILARALDELGIGAKTSSGYGRMIFIDPPIKPADPQLLMAQGYIRDLTAMPIPGVAGGIHAYYQRWKDLTLDEARLLLAQAIIDKIEQAKRTRATADKNWYKELRAFLDEH